MSPAGDNRPGLSRLRRGAILASVFLAGTILSPRPAYAIFGIDTAPIVAAITTMQGVLNGAMGAVEKAVSTGMGLLNKVTGNGFTQLSNYMKAQVGAQQQIANANNMVQLRSMRDIRNAGLRDNYTTNRQDCLNLNGGQSVVVAASNANDVAQALATAKTQRGAAGPGTPSYNGGAQGVEASNQLHTKQFCDANDAEAGLCSLPKSSALQDADQDAGHAIGVLTYPDQDSIDAAAAYESNLIQPVAPPDLRGSARSSAAGRNMAPLRRSYNAAMSLSHEIANGVIGTHAQTVTLTTAQKEEQTHEGLPSSDKVSVNEAAELEVNRRYSGLQYQKDLQAMPPGKPVEIQIAMMLAQQNWILWQQYKLQQQQALAVATLLAHSAE
ncbi:hypothetical protein, partial [Asaia bogorensis]